MRFIYLILILQISGCAISEYDRFIADSGLREVELGIVFIDQNKRQIYSEYLPKKAYISFPVIPGGITGNVLTDSMYGAVVSTDRKFLLDLEAIRENTLQFAVPMLTTPYSHNLSIVPKETRLLRLGTFAYDIDTLQQLGPTGLGAVIEDKLIQYVLVYFDRPSKVSGSNFEGDVIVEYDVVVEQAGFVFLEVKEVDEKHLKIIHSESELPKSITVEYGISKEISA